MSQKTRRRDPVHAVARRPHRPTACAGPARRGAGPARRPRGMAHALAALRPGRELGGALSTSAGLIGVSMQIVRSQWRRHLPIEQDTAPAHPLVLLHGGEADHAMFDGLVRAARTAISPSSPTTSATRTPRVIPPHPLFPLADLADDAAALIRGPRPRPCPCDGDLARRPDFAGAGGAASCNASAGSCSPAPSRRRRAAARDQPRGLSQARRPARRPARHGGPRSAAYFFPGAPPRGPSRGGRASSPATAATPRRRQRRAAILARPAD